MAAPTALAFTRLARSPRSTSGRDGRRFTGVLRGVAFAFLACVSLGVAAAGAACGEHFPQAPAAPTDAGVALDEEGGPLEATPPAVIDPTKRVNATSSPVVFDPVRGRRMDRQRDVGTVSYVDPDRRVLVQEIAFAALASPALVAKGLGPDRVGLPARTERGSPPSIARAAPSRWSIRMRVSCAARSRSAPTRAPASGTPPIRAGSTSPSRTTPRSTSIDRTLGARLDHAPAQVASPRASPCPPSSREIYVPRIDGEVTIVLLPYVERAGAAAVEDVGGERGRSRWRTRSAYCTPATVPTAPPSASSRSP